MTKFRSQSIEQEPQGFEQIQTEALESLRSGFCWPAQCVLELPKETDIQKFVDAIKYIVSVARAWENFSSEQPVIVSQSIGPVASDDIKATLDTWLDEDKNYYLEKQMQSSTITGLNVSFCHTTEKQIFGAFTLNPLLGDSFTLRDIVIFASEFYSDPHSINEIHPYKTLQIWRSSLLEKGVPHKANEFWNKVVQEEFSNSIILGEVGSPGIGEWKNKSVMLPSDLAKIFTRLIHKDKNGPLNYALTCWLITLQRVYGHNAYKCAFSIDCRRLDAMRTILGPIQHWLPIHIEEETEIPFIYLLDKVASFTHQAAYWQEYLPLVVENLNAKKTKQLKEIETGFEFLDWKDSKLENEGIVNPILVKGWNNLKPLSLRLLKNRETWTLDVTWNTGVFDKIAIDGIVEGLFSVARMASNSDLPIARLKLASSASIPPIKEEAFVDDSSIIDLIKHWVQKQPENVAIIDGHGEMNYRDLWGTSINLAGLLIKQGINPGDHVGIVCSRTRWFPVTALATLQIGACYIPIDPIAGKEIVLSRLKQSNVKLVITDHDYTEWFSKMSHLVIPEEIPKDCFWKNTISVSKNDKKHPCYAVLTSGSSGRPKLVGVSYKTLALYLIRIGELIGVSNHDRWLHAASIGFNSSNRQLFAPLVHGASIIISSDNTRRDMTQLLRWIRKHRVTILDTTPTVLDSMIATIENWIVQETHHNWLKSVRIVISASEPLAGKTYEQFRHTLDYDGVFFNMYGLTETCGLVTGSEIKSCNNASTIQIGKPFPGNKAIILDPFLQEVPNGVPGEIYIGEPALAIGYLGDPILSATSFIPSIWGNGERMFRTGDRGRKTTNDMLQVFGRINDVVKIRGERVSLLEVSSVVGQFPGVIRAVAMKIDKLGVDEIGVAVLAKQKENILIDELRVFTRRFLPPTAVPTSIVIVEQLPQTRNGKIDRDAIRDLLAGFAEQPKLMVKPETKNEHFLLELWKQVLPDVNISVTDNFFDIGGHSLIAAQLVARIMRRFDIDINITFVFKYPSIREQSTQLEIILQENLAHE